MIVKKKNYHTISKYRFSSSARKIMNEILNNNSISIKDSNLRVMNCVYKKSFDLVDKNISITIQEVMLRYFEINKSDSKDGYTLRLNAFGILNYYFYKIK